MVLALPHTPQTEGLINAEAIACMKPGGVLVNVGRGAVVDEAALVDALRRNAIAGAALDVFAVEPLPEGHAFYSLENVLMSFHCADLTAGRNAQSHYPTQSPRPITSFISQLRSLRLARTHTSEWET